MDRGNYSFQDVHNVQLSQNVSTAKCQNNIPKAKKKTANSRTPAKKTQRWKLVMFTFSRLKPSYLHSYRVRTKSSPDEY